MSGNACCDSGCGRPPSPVAVLVACLTAAIAVGARGTEVYYDYVAVLNVEPVTESRLVPVSATLCPETSSVPSASSLETGDIRVLAPTLPPGESIRLERKVGPEPTSRCQRITRYETRHAVTAYRITYRYGDETFVRLMRRHPGDRVQVRIELDPVGRADDRPWRRR